MKRGLLALGLLALVAGEGAARAEGHWTKTFTPAASASYVDRHRGLLVVGAGGEAAEGAADALRKALRSGRAAKVVMDAGALGAVDALDDQAIVKRAAALPVDEVAVVRVFPGADRDNAVVTFYDKGGKVMAALAGEDGVPLAVRARDTAGGGVSGDAADTVHEVLKTDPGSGAGSRASTPEREYDLHYLGAFRSTESGTHYQMVGQVSSWYEGKFQRPLALGEFFNIVNRPELAADYESSRRGHTVMRVAGIFTIALALPIGVVLAALSPIGGSCVFSYNDSSCTSYSPGMLWSGLAITAIGLGVGIPLLVIGNRPPPSPVSPEEERDMANAFNRDLRKKLNLPPQTGALAPPSFTLSLSPGLGPQGGGLSLRGTF